ncbi:HAD family hydrolase [Sinimarinibacterium sp. NLF-5-8]|uniref:KdsC family phosphatase n=1 Tax=Sinimarinibacterium sp. NLF-5-8 TaxID=2698684 RepID=UPI00137BDC19|nr:HAD-IIIA family hydrolase [Sinimarinibacterium sp. NLF-5-8]QHS11130.1 HAD-IIIA family hydrolase [Sinimarinibacterium sp. NLF-5-8]
MEIKMSKDVRARAEQVRCIFLDVDGVLTDGKLYIGANGEETKTNFVRDGYGIKLALKQGFEIAVISGRPSAAMQQRCEWLGIRHVAMNAENKEQVYRRIITQLGLSDAQCAAIGDDVPDLPLMQRVGLAMSVADAHPSALAAAHWVSQYNGGHGAVREALDLILGSQGKLPA